MNRLSLAVVLAVAGGMGSFEGRAGELSAPMPIHECSGISGNYEVTGKQLAGPDIGSKLGPSLPLHVFRGYRVHKPGARAQSVKLFVHDGEHLSVAILDGNNSPIAEDEVLGKCESGEFIFSKTATGGSEGYSGTTSWGVRLAAKSDSSLLANVETKSDGKDFFLFPHSASATHTFSFRRVVQ